jgi:hypothetical protein
MRPAQQVTALRKEGKLDEAFALALELVANPDANEWDSRAYGWCLIALVKHHASDTDPSSLQRYLGLLNRFEVPGADEMLTEHRERALALADEDGRAIMEARKLGKDGQHDRAVFAFSSLNAKGILNEDEKTAFGWELYRASRAIFQKAERNDLLPGAVDTIKRHLNIYLKLGIAKSDRLHSLTMQQAVRLSRDGHLRLVAFARLWNLELFQREDLRETRSDDGKVFPALAETVIQRASKEAAQGGSPAEMTYILPHLERGIERFPENPWLKLNLVKLLRALGRVDEARTLALEFARAKAGEFWTWDLIGDLEIDPTMKLSCYAKALTCSEDDTFVVKVRLKFASLIFQEYSGEAKFEVERVIDCRNREGSRVPEGAQRMSQSAWFLAAIPRATGKSFYERFTARAEELLFAHLPWTDAIVGDQFVIEGQDGQKDKRRTRILLKADPISLEISVTSKHPDLRNRLSGTPISMQMEMAAAEPWKATVHRIRARDGTGDEAVPELNGVIDHVNDAKALAHFVVAKGIDGTFPIADLEGEAAIGNAIAVRIARYRSRTGERTRTLSVRLSTHSPGPNVLKPFNEDVEVRNGLGFTPAGIFIPRDMVSALDLSDGDNIAGKAVINFDKKRNAWGWKALTAELLGKAP